MNKYYLCGALIILLASCSPVYVPNMRNTPLFTKAGEFQGSFHYGTGGLDVQSAVSVTNNFGLMANLSYGNRNTNTDESTTTGTYDNDYHKHKLYEGGIGYFKNDKTFCFEVFAGYGVGEGTSYGSYEDIFSSSDNELATGKFSRIFIQPSFGFNKKVVHVGFTPRISYVDFTEFTTTNNSTGTSVIETRDPAPAVFFEPSVTTRFNFIDNRFFATLQVGVCASFEGKNMFDHEPFSFSTGLGFRLGGLHWNEKQE
jgi:hypothetical protein